MAVQFSVTMPVYLMTSVTSVTVTMTFTPVAVTVTMEEEEADNVYSQSNRSNNQK